MAKLEEINLKNSGEKEPMEMGEAGGENRAKRREKQNEREKNRK